MKGSMTVEASLVFPFCFLIIVIICCLGIFKYNQAVLKVTGYECVVHTMDLREESDKILQKTIESRALQTAKERVLGVENLEVFVKATASKIAVSYLGKQHLLNLPLEITVVYERVCPELTLRLLSETKGG